MTVSRKHSLSAVVFDDTVPVVLGGITQSGVNTGTEVRNDPTSGGVYPEFQSVVAQKPSVSFTTLAIAAALDQAALSGLSIATLANGLSVFVQKHAEGGTRAGATSHRKYKMREGLIIPRTLSVAHQADASLPYDVMVTYDGSNDPIEIVDDVSLPATVTDAERFTLGGITIESVAIPEVRSFELAFGINAQTEGTGSDIWDTFVSIHSIQPVITIRGIDIEWAKAANIPLIGKAATHANTTIYLRKRGAGGTFVADGENQHIKLTADGLAVIQTPFEGSGDAAGECTLVMQCRQDNVPNPPIIIDTTSAIV